MQRDDALARIVELLDEMDRVRKERKSALLEHDEQSGRLALVHTFKVREEEIWNDLTMCRQDARQMRLGDGDENAS